MIVRKSSADIDAMARAGEVVVGVLAELGESVRPGVATAELDEIAEEFIRSCGGVPTFKGYNGFPSSICASPNSVVVHGIPGPYRLEDGDIISIDVGVTLGGFVADSACTFGVGAIDPDTQRLLDICQAALEAGIDQARPGNRIGDISAAIQRTTEAANFSVVRTLVGHGIGRSMHEDPQIPNFGESGRGPKLTSGMTLAIEPMINAGAASVFVEDDQWTVSTSDGSLAAHFEHTVAIANDGPRILTRGSRPDSGTIKDR